MNGRGLHEALRFAIGDTRAGGELKREREAALSGLRYAERACAVESRLDAPAMRNAIAQRAVEIERRRVELDKHRAVLADQSRAAYEIGVGSPLDHRLARNHEITAPDVATLMVNPAARERLRAQLTT